jgi:hypothetical protein
VRSDGAPNGFPVADQQEAAARFGDLLLPSSQADRAPVELPNVPAAHTEYQRETKTETPITKIGILCLKSHGCNQHDSTPDNS